MKNKNFCYFLSDPRTGECRYIGKTEQGESRLLEHLKPSSLKYNNHKNNWIKHLLELGLKPRLEIIEEFLDPNDLFEAEEFWYQYFKGLGCNLTNSTECGKGTRGYQHKEETIELLKKRAATRDNTSYKNPINKKEHIVINGIEHRECTRCNKTKTLSDFRKCRKWWSSFCNKCHTDFFREWRKENPTETLPEAEYNASRLPGAIAGGNAMKAPEQRARASQQRSKPIQAIHTVTGEKLIFKSALEAKARGYQNSNIGVAIKLNKPYRGYHWSFITEIPMTLAT